MHITTAFQNKMGIVGTGILSGLRPVVVVRALRSPIGFHNHFWTVSESACRSCATSSRNSIAQSPSLTHRTMHATFATASGAGPKSIEELGSKRCLACEGGDVEQLSDNEIAHLAALVPFWEVGTTERGEKCVTRRWKVRNFMAGLELFKRIAEIAESEGHHPDLHLVGYNQVSAQLTTHSAGGLTENDFIMAAKIDKVELTDILSRRKAKV